MYIPASFSETDRERLFDFIEQNNFGLLVSQLGDEPFATHLPLLVDRRAGACGMLLGHMARANPQWQAAEGNVLVVFSGPHVYISPSWYEADDVVPTWNYVAVHVYGRLMIVENDKEVLDLLRTMVIFQERSMVAPWELPPSANIARLAKSIVAFRIEIVRMEGKWKLSQNQPAARRKKVLEALALRPARMHTRSPA